MGTREVLCIMPLHCHCRQRNEPKKSLDVQAEMEAAIEEERKKVGNDCNNDMGMGEEVGDFMEVEPRSHAHHPARSKRRR